MEYTEAAQQDRIEPPNAGQAIPYEDYSVAAEGVTTEDDEGDERVAMKHSKPPHHHQKKHQQRSSRKRSISTSSSDSSRSSSSSSILSSSSSDESGSDGDNATTAVKKKKRKKKEATQTGDKKRKVGGKRQQPQKATTDSTTTDDGSINKLISVALRSQKKQYKNQIIQSVKSDLMNTLRSRIVQHQQQRGKKKNVGGGDDEEGTNDDVDAATTSGTTDKQYRKRIKQAYRELEEGYDDAPKFNSKQHKKTIGSILSKLGEVNDIQLYRIPHIDKEMGFDKMDIGGNGGDTKLTKKMLSASPDKTIPEAVYAALKDAYSSCMLYKYFFRRIYPYLTVPYISK